MSNADFSQIINFFLLGLRGARCVFDDTLVCFGNYKIARLLSYRTMWKKVRASPPQDARAGENRTFFFWHVGDDMVNKFLVLLERKRMPIKKCKLAEKEGSFKIDDVVEKITSKLIRRHPHVFDKDTPQTEDLSVIMNRWQAIKRKEKEVQRN